MVRLEAKAIGRPKPEVKWMRAGEEIIANEEYQIETFEDGTSILVINDIYPDDTGVITFEAHNALGVAETTTELVVGGTIKLIKNIENCFLLIYLCIYLMNILFSGPRNLFSNGTFEFSANLPIFILKILEIS